MWRSNSVPCVLVRLISQIGSRITFIINIFCIILCFFNHIRWYSLMIHNTTMSIKKRSQARNKGHLPSSSCLSTWWGNILATRQTISGAHPRAITAYSSWNILSLEVPLVVIYFTGDISGGGGNTVTTELSFTPPTNSSKCCLSKYPHAACASNSTFANSSILSSSNMVLTQH